MPKASNNMVDCVDTFLATLLPKDEDVTLLSIVVVATSVYLNRGFNGLSQTTAIILNQTYIPFTLLAPHP